MGNQFGITAPIGIVGLYQELFDDAEIKIVKKDTSNGFEIFIVEDDQNLYSDLNAWVAKVSTIIGWISRESGLAIGNKRGTAMIDLYQPTKRA